MGWRLSDEGLAPAILNGDFDSSPPSGVDFTDWSLAKEWNTALIAHGAQMPKSIKGMKGLQTLSMFEELLCPVWLYYPFMLKRHKAEDLPKMMAAAEEELSGVLKEHGY